MATQRKILVAQHDSVFDHAFDKWEKDGWKLDGLPYYETDQFDGRETWYQKIVKQEAETSKSKGNENEKHNRNFTSGAVLFVRNILSRRKT